MERRFHVITVDCHGTLIDWESGIANAFLGAARQDGIDLRRVHDVLQNPESARLLGGRVLLQFALE